MTSSSTEQRAVWRREILATTKEDFVKFGERLEEKLADSSCTAVFGSKQAIEDANVELEKQGKPTLEIKELL